MLHSYPWYIDDWHNGRTRPRMSLGARALYRDAIDLCYRDGSIPDEEQTLCRMLLCTPAEFKKYWPEVRERLIKLESGDLTHERAQQEIPFLISMSEVRRKSASGAAKVRWEKHRAKLEQSAGIAPRNAGRIPDALPDALRTQCGVDAETCGSSASASASASANTAGASGIPFEEFFEQLYSEHPRKKDRTIAAGYLSEIQGIETQEVQSKILKAHAAWMATPDWEKENRKYVPSLAKWIEDKAYNYPPKPNGSVNGCSSLSIPRPFVSFEERLRNGEFD